MKINEQIRENRKKAGLTQEQVASYLGVSTPAVNKWEKGVTYPDITLLPVLARLLKIDLNTLFSFHEEMTEAEVKCFIAKLIEECQKDLDKGFEVAMEKTKEYPNCMKLLHSTAVTLNIALLLSGLPSESKIEYEKKIIALYECVAEGADGQLRDRALSMLSSWYLKSGEYERSQEMLNRLPDENLLDKRDTQAELYINQNKLLEAAALMERKLQEQVQNIQIILIKLTDIAIKEENYENASYIANISKECVKLFNFSGQFAYIAPLEAALGKKDIPESISLIEKMMNAMQIRWKYEDMVLYHHIAQTQDKDVLEKLKNSDEEYKKIAKKQILPPLLAELDNASKYEFLHSDERFQQMVKRYKAMVEEE